MGRRRSNSVPLGAIGIAAMIEALAWPEKSEVLITGINIADMAGIVGSLGHVPVPIDLDPETLAPDPAQIVSKIGPATRAIVVAQLFGGRIEMGPLVDVARRHGLLTIDDSAQAYATRSNCGPRACDVRLFSFGLLKSGSLWVDAWRRSGTWFFAGECEPFKPRGDARPGRTTERKSRRRSCCCCSDRRCMVCSFGFAQLRGHRAAQCFAGLLVGSEVAAPTLCSTSFAGSPAPRC